MKKTILRLYGIVAVLFFLMFVYGFVTLRLAVRRDMVLTGMDEIINFTIDEIADENAPMGKRYLMAFQLGEIHGDYNTVAFYSFHQNVKVYLNYECIYRLESKKGFMIPRSPGTVYNMIKCAKVDSGKQMRIELTPVYRGEVRLPSIYFGSRYEIIKDVIYANLATLLISSLTLAVGVCLLVCVILDKQRQYDARITIFRSLFIIVVAIWKLLNCEATALVGVYLPAMGILPYFALLVLPIFFVEFIRTLANAKRVAEWMIPEFFTVGTITLVLILQMLNIADIRECLMAPQVCLFVSFLFMFLGIRREVKENDWTRNSKRALIATICGIAWIAIDIFTYYGLQGTNTYPVSILVFLVLIGILLWDDLRMSQKRMAVGMRARHYRQLAYHDALTGFFNRTAYTEYLNTHEKEARKNLIVAFDLNDLKKCNDDFGHDKGDIYIKESAKILTECFGDKGKCYRLGGDEFGVILEEVSEEECIGRIAQMEEMVERFNRESTDIRMGIASGYACYDENEDADIHDTIRRADKMMYEVKFRMKQIKNS